MFKRYKPIDCLFLLALLALPGAAYAQRIPGVVAALAISPILVLSLCVALGIATRNWLVGIGNAILVLFWVTLFLIASYWVENDYIIWTPLVLYGLHAVVLVALVARSILRRVRHSD